jgi:chromosome segregation ATPase
MHAASEAKAVTIKLERELGQVQRVVQEGEETVARLRDQLEELHEQEEATQLQLAHALTQVDKAMSERDIYAGVAKRWQAKGEGEATKARDEAQHQLRVQTAQHRSQHRRYKTEIHQLKSLLSQDKYCTFCCRSLAQFSFPTLFSLCLIIIQLSW